MFGALALTVVGLFTNTGAAFVDGPPPALTGGFGEETCRKCHFDYDLNDNAGSLTVSGVPEEYVPGEQYTIAIRLTHPRMERGGFELAARFASGENAGRQAGSFELSDDRSTIDRTTSIQYVHHTRAGAATSSKGSITWAVRWRAPETGNAQIVFNISANAANFDDSPLGDYPYAAEIRTRMAGF